MDKPLDISDLGGLPHLPLLKDGTDVWYWCRQHTKAHHATYSDQWTDCVLVGPFMSEVETRRCDALGSAYLLGLQRRDPLGMTVEVERL